jgi:hypothetical protein
MKYGQQDITFVDFPGEYDIHGHAVICYATDELLHYIISVDDKRYAIIQDSFVIQKEDFEHIDIWVVTDESIKREIERQELEGSIQLMSELTAAAEVLAEEKRVEREEREAQKEAERLAKIVEKEAAKIATE